MSAKRNIGEYVGNYVSYGYKKCDTDKSQIEIDPVAAKHVRDIFNWKMEGMSNQLIADKLMNWEFLHRLITNVRPE